MKDLEGIVTQSGLSLTKAFKMARLKDKYREAVYVAVIATQQTGKLSFHGFITYLYLWNQQPKLPSAEAVFVRPNAHRFRT